ncbi:MAG: GNAT family N-acetyltransferase [Pseudomonadota bacterium]
MTPVIGVAPYALRPGPGLASTPLSQIAFPLGLSERLSGGTLGDLGPDDHVIFFPKSSFYWPRPLGIAAQPSLMIAEPRAVHARHMALLRVFYRRFFRVLTRDPTLQTQIPNALPYSHMESWIPDTVDTTKSRHCSLIASAKRDQPGHKLRHRIVEAIRAEGLDIDIMGRGYAPFEAKEDGLAPYHFSVIIENSQEPGYITEKLLDACLCRTIPLYWGAPDVGDYLDPSGMVICDSEAALMTALRAPPDPASFAPALEANRETARDLAQGPLRAALTLASELGDSKPVLTTHRLHLRPYRIADTQPLHRFFRDPEAMRYWGNRHRTLTETLDFVRMTMAADPATTCEFVIERDGEVIGKAGMWRAPEIGFFILPGHQRKEYAYEALSALIPHLFARYDISHLTADVDPRNTACLALLARLGFTETHRAERTIEIDGDWCDSIYFQLTRP